MIYLNDVFWILVVLFAIIGFFRGAAKEMLVILSVIVALFFITLMMSNSFVKNELAGVAGGKILFGIQLLLIIVLVIAGYQTPYRKKLPIKDQISANPRVEKILGGIVGGVNGYLIIGTIWYYMHKAAYPISFISSPENAGAEILEKTNELMKMFPAQILQPTTIYFAIGIAITIILVLYI